MCERTCSILVRSSRQSRPRNSFPHQNSHGISREHLQYMRLLSCLCFGLTNVIGGGRSRGTLRLTGRLEFCCSACSTLLLVSAVSAVACALPLVGTTAPPPSPSRASLLSTPFNVANEDRQRLRTSSLLLGCIAGTARASVALRCSCTESVAAVVARSQAAAAGFVETVRVRTAARDPDIVTATFTPDADEYSGFFTSPRALNTTCS